MNPKVSVIVPTYNVELYIEKCLDTIINQTLEDIEIIVINDGSTDRTEQIVNKFAKKDNRVKLVNQINCGVSSARNNGLNLAKGDYIVFIDPDDYIDKDMLKKMYLMAQEFKCEVIQCNYTINNQGVYKEVNHNIKENKLLQDYEIVKYIKMGLIDGSLTTYVWDKMYKRSFLQQNNLKFREDLSMFEDWHFIMDTVCYLNKFVLISENLYYYRIVKNSLCRHYISNYEELLIDLQLRKINYIENWNLDKEPYKSKYIISLYDDIIKLINYILDENHKLNKNTQIIKFNTIIESSLIDNYFNKKNDNLYISNTPINPLYLKPILFAIREKKSLLIYLWIKTYKLVKKG